MVRVVSATDAARANPTPLATLYFSFGSWKPALTR